MECRWGTGFTLSVLELVDLLERLTGERLEVVHEAAPEEDQKVFYSCIRKLQKDLGWHPGYRGVRLHRETYNG